MSGRKYHNKPTERVTASGAVLRFDSKKEARRYPRKLLEWKSAAALFDEEMRAA